MDRFDAMRAYVQVIECGSFTSAARSLTRHKATVSQQVRQLEDLLATRLLTRTTRSVAPTAEGLAYYHRACAILQQVDDAESMLRNATGSASGRLRVEVPVAIGRLVLVPEIRRFLDRHPRIVLELGCTDRTVDLVKEGVDCALRGGELPDSTLVSRKVGEVPFVLCAAPRYVDEHGLPREPEDLRRHTRVGYRPASRSDVPDIRLWRGDRIVEVSVPMRLVTTDSGAVLGAGLDGLGIIQIAEYVASHHLASGALIQVLPTWRGPVMPLHLVAPTARQRTARVQAFMEWAQALLAKRFPVGAGARHGD